jgi:hypothetical protein
MPTRLFDDHDNTQTRRRAIVFRVARRWSIAQNVKAIARGIAMSPPQFSHALERRGDANT